VKVSISEAAEVMGVCTETLRRWEAAGKIEAERTKGGFRRFDLAKLQVLIPPKAKGNRETLCYARVSSSDQKSDLVTQVALLEAYCCARGWSYSVLQDLGSGLNYQKKGLRLLIHKICNREVERLVLTNKDRLLRFGSELIFGLCEQFGVEVVIINAFEPASFEEELTNDVLEIITVFSARLYGSRSHKNKKLIASMREAVSDSSVASEQP
jgi:excisionase family DNA binding protein